MVFKRNFAISVCLILLCFSLVQAISLFSPSDLEDLELILKIGLINSDLDQQWGNFKATFNKAYNNLEQELSRRSIWEANIEYIQKHNLEYDLGQHSFFLGVNEYADLDAEEYKTKILMRNRAPTKKREGATFLAPSNLQAPDSLDWRTEGYVTEVKNQKQCGVCWAFCATGALEGQHFRKDKQLVSLSEQNLLDCSVDSGNNGCAGGIIDGAFKYIKENTGVDTESSYPYEGQQSTCRFNKDNVGASLVDYVDITEDDEASLLEAVASVGPVAVTLDASQDSYRFYKGGVYNDPQCTGKTLNHGGLIVGYGSTSDGQKYWIIKNSYGTSWGDQGYMLLARDNNQCGVASEASYPLV